MKSLLIFLLSFNLCGATFDQAVKAIEAHSLIGAKSAQAEARAQEGAVLGSWGDPLVRISAKNYPVESWKPDQTPMTGIEFSLGQKIALTNKYGKLKKSFGQKAESINYYKDDLKKDLTLKLWQLILSERRLDREIIILNESLNWLDKMIAVTKKLYANGSVAQQALLDMEIQKNELLIQRSLKQSNLLQLAQSLVYLTGHKKIDLTSVPWEILESSSAGEDYKELALGKSLQAAELSVSAAKLNFIPDITLSVSYTKRSELDGIGDFAALSISFPLPFSSVKYGTLNKAIANKLSAQQGLHNYQESKKRDLRNFQLEIDSFSEQLRILQKKSILFARNSRDITAKSYRLGNATYSELLQADLKLNKILLDEARLIEMRDRKIIELKKLKGENLHA